MKKRIISALVLVCLLLTGLPFPAHASGEPQAVRFQGGESGTEYVGCDNYIGVSFFPEGFYISYTITSSDESVVSLIRDDPNGAYRASYLKEGTAVLTINTENHLTATCTVTVKNTAGSFALGESKTVTLQPHETIVWSFDYEEYGNYLLYCSDDRFNVVDFIIQTSCDHTERLGKCHFTLDENSQYCRLEAWNSSMDTAHTITVSVVKPIPIESLSFDDRYSLKPLYIDDAGHSLPAIFAPNTGAHEELLWESSDTSVARVSYFTPDEFTGTGEDYGLAYGSVHAVAPGTCTITVSTPSGKSASYDITVLEPEAVNVGWEKEVTFDENQRHYMCSFTPEESGTYVFYGEANGPHVDNAEILSSDGFISVVPFIMQQRTINQKDCIAYFFEAAAGKTYYLEWRELYNEEVTSELHLEKALPPAESISIKPSAEEYGIAGRSYTFTVCQGQGLEAPEPFTVVSSDKSVAKWSNEDGNTEWDCNYLYVNCVGAGTATITVTTATGKSASYDLTVYENKKYQITPETGAQWNPSSDTGLSFELNMAQEQFSYVLWRKEACEGENITWGDHEWIDLDNYTLASNGSGMTLTLNKAFLETFEPGEYELHLIAADGYAKGMFQIQEAAGPQPHTHAYGSWTTVKAPICTQSGQEKRTCKTCGQEQTRELSASGHSYGPWKETLAPTAIAEGKEVRRCSVCGVEESRTLPKHSNPFTDISSSAYYYNPVLWAANKKIVYGTSNTTFSPETVCTRAQIVSFLWRAAGCPEPTSFKNPFKDVKANAWYEKAVLWAVETGITAGTSKNTFSPEAPCTRAQVVTFLWRAAGKPTPANAKNPFTDLNPAEYYYAAVQWAAENSITAGISATKFGPNANCTRAQIVSFLYRSMTQ